MKINHNKLRLAFKDERSMNYYKMPSQVNCNKNEKIDFYSLNNTQAKLDEPSMIYPWNASTQRKLLLQEAFNECASPEFQKKFTFIIAVKKSKFHNDQYSLKKILQIYIFKNIENSKEAFPVSECNNYCMENNYKIDDSEKEIEESQVILSLLPYVPKRPRRTKKEKEFQKYPDDAINAKINNL